MMDLRALKFENKALDIATLRPKFWEYFLYSQLLNDEIEYVKLALLDKSQVKQRLELKFKSITDSNDLRNLVEVLKSRLKTIARLSEEVRTLLPANHPDAFGPPGVPGNPAAIMIMSRKVANLYYDVGLLLNEATLELELFDNFFDRNMDNSVELDRLIHIAMVKGNQFLIATANNVLIFMEGLGPYIRSRVESTISGTPSTETHTANGSDPKEMIAAFEAATICCEAQLLTKTARPTTKKTPSNSSENQFQRFASVHDIVVWLSDKSSVTLAEMRNILLPLDLFPGAFIDDINERALEAVGEMALSEDGKNIGIDQEILLEVSVNWKD